MNPVRFEFHLCHFLARSHLVSGASQLSLTSSLFKGHNETAFLTGCCESLQGNGFIWRSVQNWQSSPQDDDFVLCPSPCPTSALQREEGKLGAGLTNWVAPLHSWEYTVLPRLSTGGAWHLWSLGQEQQGICKQILRV